MLPLTAGGLTYLAAFRLMKGPELQMLRGRLPERSEPEGGTGSASVPYAEPLQPIASAILMTPDQEFTESTSPRLEQPVHSAAEL